MDRLTDYQVDREKKKQLKKTQIGNKIPSASVFFKYLLNICVVSILCEVLRMLVQLFER